MMELLDSMDFDSVNFINWFYVIIHDLEIEWIWMRIIVWTADSPLELILISTIK